MKLVIYQGQALGQLVARHGMDALKSCAVPIAPEISLGFDEGSECFRALVPQSQHPAAQKIEPAERAQRIIDGKAKQLATFHERWSALHKRALAGQLTAPWLAEFEQSLPCGDCRAFWRALVVITPPPVGADVDAQFVWSANAHNAVNRKLGKPELTIDQARRIWIAP